MLVRFSETEIKHAMMEWAQKRGIPITEKHEMRIINMGDQYNVEVNNVNPVVSEGPYR